MKEIDIAKAVDEVAKIISGAPFPSLQSIRRARKVVEFLVLNRDPQWHPQVHEPVACRYRHRRKNGQFFPWVHADRMPAHRIDGSEYELLYTAPPESKS